MVQHSACFVWLIPLAGAAEDVGEAVAGAAEDAGEWIAGAAEDAGDFIMDLF